VSTSTSLGGSGANSEVDGGWAVGSERAIRLCNNTQHFM
jgi:hypothetical protein